MYLPKTVIDESSAEIPALNPRVKAFAESRR
jgi:hypothetical protein